MLVLTKKMKEDIAKQREQDIFVCDACGSDKITEKMWVETNSYISIDGETYYKADSCLDDDSMFWCESCYEEANPILKEDYKEEEWR